MSSAPIDLPHGGARGPVPTPTDIRVDAGRYDDLDRVSTIMERAFAPCFGEGWTKSQCAGILPLPGVALQLARDAADGEVIGFSLWRVIYDEAELLLLAVDPAAQGRGVGRALVDEFVTGAAAAGAHHLHLEVRESNKARRLYELAGFAEAGRRRAYYHGRDGSAHDAITLVRRLDD